MSNIETFREITGDDIEEVSSRWNFIPINKYARMAPVENEVGSLVNIQQQNAVRVLRSGCVDGASIERLTMHSNLNIDAVSAQAEGA